MTPQNQTMNREVQSFSDNLRSSVFRIGKEKGFKKSSIGFLQLKNIGHPMKNGNVTTLEGRVGEKVVPDLIRLQKGTLGLLYHE